LRLGFENWLGKGTSSIENVEVRVAQLGGNEMIGFKARLELEKLLTVIKLLRYHLHDGSNIFLGGIEGTIVSKLAATTNISSMR
jgi:hypothetical protein